MILSYRVEGSGFPLILVHGWGVSHSVWSELVRYLSPHFKLIMVELPGIGGSALPDPERPYHQTSAEAIEELRESLGIEKWAMLSYSTGTRVAERYQRDYGSRVSFSVFLCPAHLRWIHSFSLRILDRLDRLSPRSTEWLLSGWRLRQFVVILGFNGKRGSTSAGWITEIERQAIWPVKEVLREIAVLGREPFRFTGVPSLFIWAARDRLMTGPVHFFGQNHVLQGVGHSAPMGVAAEIATVVLEFVEHDSRHSLRAADRVSTLLAMGGSLQETPT